MDEKQVPNKEISKVEKKIIKKERKKEEKEEAAHRRLLKMQRRQRIPRWDTRDRTP